MVSKSAPQAFLPTFLLSLGVSFFCFSPPARSAEQVTLKYMDTQRTFSLTEIEDFARNGQAASSNLEQFFQTHPEIERIMRDLLDAQIYISPEFVDRVKDRLHSSTGEFILLEVNKLIDSSSTGQQDLDSLRTALVDSYKKDNRLSLLELIANYPKPSIFVNLTGLEPVYMNVKGFVERILPALEAAKQFLQEYICDCQSQPASSSASPAPESSPQSKSMQSSDRSNLNTASQATNCANSSTVNQENQISSPRSSQPVHQTLSQRQLP
jgi:hypothetical protein